MLLVCVTALILQHNSCSSEEDKYSDRSRPNRRGGRGYIDHRQLGFLGKIRVELSTPTDLPSLSALRVRIEHWELL